MNRLFERTNQVLVEIWISGSDHTSWCLNLPLLLLLSSSLEARGNIRQKVHPRITIINASVGISRHSSLKLQSRRTNGSKRKLELTISIEFQPHSQIPDNTWWIGHFYFLVPLEKLKIWLYRKDPIRTDGRKIDQEIKTFVVHKGCILIVLDFAYRRRIWPRGIESVVWHFCRIEGCSGYYTSHWMSGIC